jgi:hypothetical protein
MSGVNNMTTEEKKSAVCDCMTLFGEKAILGYPQEDGSIVPGALDSETLNSHHFERVYNALNVARGCEPKNEQQLDEALTDFIQFVFYSSEDNEIYIFNNVWPDLFNE